MVNAVYVQFLAVQTPTIKLQYIRSNLLSFTLGGNIAASWVAIRALGEDGYMKRAKELMDATDRLKEGVRQIEGLKILGTPHMTCFAIGAADPEVDIQAVADVMDGKGERCIL